MKFSSSFLKFIVHRLSFIVHILSFIVLISGCTYTMKIKDGKTAHQQKQFANALPLLEKEFAKAKLRSEKGKLAYLIADSYNRTGQTEKSESWYKISYDNNFGPEALKGWAFSLKKQEKYLAANDAFKNLGIEIGSPYEYRKEIAACNIAADWQKQTAGNGWKIEPAPFNSGQNDFSPIFFADEKIVFTSDRNLATEGKSYGWTGNKFMDLLVVGSDEASAQGFDLQLNTPGNEGTAVFSKNFQEAFFVRAAGAYKYDDQFCKIYFTQKNNGEESWETPQPLPFQKEKINYLHPAFSPDGNVLVFAANDPEGWGGFDLYAVQRTSATENGWGEPRILSRAINSPGNELFPTFDGDTLYFSSDGLTGMGGLDIFKTYKLDKTTWSPPQNLKSPVNSGADDFGFIVDSKRRFAKKSSEKPKPGDLLFSGFFTSNRSGGRGGDDVYKHEFRQPAPPPPKPVEPEKPKTAHKMVLEGFVLEKIFAVPGDPNSQVLGRRPLPGATVGFEISGKKQTVTVGEDGLFKIDLTANTDYFFTANKPEYLSNSARFSTKGIAVDRSVAVQTYEVEVVLGKIFKNKEIVLENIYYDYDKWDIRPDAEPTLNELAEVLRQNATVRIQLGSHTDCRGNDNYNRQLSQQRAQSAVNYLISRGIAAERLAAIGFGEEQPTAECICGRCTESEHQANRRTTFRILE